MRTYGMIAILLASLAGMPSLAFAQAIAGAVNDADGAALSDATVQAESGVYTLTFMREGFPLQGRKSVGDIR